MRALTSVAPKNSSENIRWTAGVSLRERTSLRICYDSKTYEIRSSGTSLPTPVAARAADRPVQRAPLPPGRTLPRRPRGRRDRRSLPAQTYYFGATGGGVWKTTDGGLSWLPISDGQFKTGSVGAIAVADSDPNMIYVGMGEACVRGNASNGDGVYKSIDGGTTWRNVGLQDRPTTSARSRVHPKNPDIVYVAALGHLWGPNEERGVYRTTDGGQTWKQVLTRGPEAGAVDLAMDPSNPARALRRFWQVQPQSVALR